MSFGRASRWINSHRHIQNWNSRRKEIICVYLLLLLSFLSSVLVLKLSQKIVNSLTNSPKTLRFFMARIMGFLRSRFGCGLSPFPNRRYVDQGSQRDLDQRDPPQPLGGNGFASRRVGSARLMGLPLRFGYSERCGLERCRSERCGLERCWSESCGSERYRSEICGSERCRSWGTTAALGINNEYQIQEDQISSGSANEDDSTNALIFTLGDISAPNFGYSVNCGYNR